MGFWRNYYWPATIVVILVLGAIIWSCFFSLLAPEEDSLKYANAQLLFSAVATIGIIFSLLFATAQFRKSLARPNLKLTFGESQKTKTSINLAQQQPSEQLIPIYAYNKGDKVASTYQIQLEMPNIFERYLVRELEGDRLGGKPSSNANTFVVSFYSYDKPEYICFVDKYVPIGRIRLRIDKRLDIKSKTLKLNYKIFGDWGEHQKGSLKITCEGIQGGRVT